MSYRVFCEICSALNYNKKCILKKLPKNKHLHIFLLNTCINTVTANENEAAKQSKKQLGLMTGWPRNMQYDCSMSPVLIWSKFYPGNTSWLFCGLWGDASAVSAQFLVGVNWTSNIIPDVPPPPLLFSRKNRIRLARKLITPFNSRMMLTLYYITKFITIRHIGKWKTRKIPAQ